MKTPVPDRSNRAGFTLIELLVVISIIALLIAMLLPALGKAREAAKASTCLGNQRQFMIAFYMYADDWENFMPIGTRAPSGPHMTALHSGVIAHYTGTRYYTMWAHNNYAYPNEALYISASSSLRDGRPPSILKCPSESYKNVWGRDMSTSYGWNSGSYGLGCSDWWDDQGALNSERRGRKRLDDIPRPQTTVMTGDWLDRDGRYEYFYYDQFTWNAAEGRPNLSTYHNGGGNALWADGHATRESRDSMHPDDFDRRK